MPGQLTDGRFVLSLTLLLILAGLFWGVSRYPALNEKALLGGDVELAAMGFDILLSVPADATRVQKTLYTSVNWMYTNWKGMTFGLLFAASLMGMLSLFAVSQCGNGFVATLFGTTIGAPLGVCVNCATPIGQGLHESGARPETSLAATMSSPTLNFVVLGMLFSMLPYYLAFLKIGFTLLFLLIVLPLLVKWLVPSQQQCRPVDTEALTAEQPGACPPDQGRQGRGSALHWLLARFSRDLWFIVRKTVPLMILAGVLGAVLVTFLPFDILADLFQVKGRIMMVGALVAVAAFGLFLPVPMSFDVIVVAALLTMGLHPRYAMVLLFTLGIFSVYPFAVMYRAHGARLVGGVSVVLLMLGVTSGVAAHYWAKYEDQRNEAFLVRQILEMSQQKDGPPVEWPYRERTDASPGRVQLISHSRPVRTTESIPVFRTPEVTVTRTKLRNRSATSNEMQFQRVEGPACGLDEPVKTSAYKLLGPFAYFRPIAAGDIDRDGWQDIVVGSDPIVGGFSIYRNQDGSSFVQQQAGLSELSRCFIGSLALVDLNNDGWLDLFVATYRQGAWIIYNDHGSYSQQSAERLPLPEETVLVAAAGFGDLDKDGDLDIVCGNWSYGEIGNLGESVRKERRFEAPLTSQDYLLRQNDSGFQAERLSGPPGATLSTLVHDWNHDGWPDVIVGNDFDEPDCLYLNDGHGHLVLQNRNDVDITTTQTTMSVTAADLNNDLQAELYFAQIAYQNRAARQQETRDWTLEGVTDLSRTQHEFADMLQSATRTRNPRLLQQVTDGDHRFVLTVDYLLRRAGMPRRGESDVALELLHEVPRSMSDLHFIASHFDTPRYIATQEEAALHIPQQFRRNVLLTREDGREVKDETAAFGLEHAGWAWNSRFADLNNDQFVDLFVVTGYEPGTIRETNQLFQNDRGTRFERITEVAGMKDHASTSACTYVDFDNDGDLDIITVPICERMRLYENRGGQAQAIQFQLRDFCGNRDGIGSRIIIHYGPDSNLHQVREIQASGGFGSGDPLIAHFGLADHSAVQRLEVFWSTGEQSQMEGPFEANAVYTITRRADADASYAWEGDNNPPL